MNDQRDQNDRTWEERGDRAYTKLTEHPGRTAMKWFALFLGLIVGLAVLGAVIGWIGSWGGEAKRITSPQNVRQQNTAIIDDWESLQATAGNVCSVGNAQNSGPADPTLTEDPAFAYEATYRRIRADYNRRMANLYEAQAVRNLPLPSNLRSYPQVAPSLKAMQSQVC